MQNNRLKEIDVVRALAFIFVVAQHILGGYSNIKGLPESQYFTLKLLYVIGKPAVPIFLCISAITLCYVYFEHIDIKTYYKKRILYILLPYIVWSAINMIMLNNKDRFSNFWIQILAGNGAYHLWYMGLIIRIYIYFPIVLLITRMIHLKSSKFKIFIFITILLSYYYMSKYQSLISIKISNLIFNNPGDVLQRIVNISSLFWFLYFVIGLYISLNYNKFLSILSNNRKLIILIYTLLAGYSYLNEIEIVRFIRIIYILFNIFSIIMVFLISQQLCKMESIYNKFKFISDYSYAGYMIHVIVLQYMATIVNSSIHIDNYLIKGILILVATCIISPAIIKIISFFPFSQYITGCKVPVLTRSFNLSTFKKTLSDNIVKMNNAMK